MIPQVEFFLNGAPPGDLYVEIHVKPHPLFDRQGQDLHCQMPIHFTMAALGGELEIPTLQGKVKLKIPPETQSGKIFRLRGDLDLKLHSNLSLPLYSHYCHLSKKAQIWRLLHPNLSLFRMFRLGKIFPYSSSFFFFFSSTSSNSASTTLPSSPEGC